MVGLNGILRLQLGVLFLQRIDFALEHKQLIVHVFLFDEVRRFWDLSALDDLVSGHNLLCGAGACLDNGGRALVLLADLVLDDLCWTLGRIGRNCPTELVGG